MSEVSYNIGDDLINRDELFGTVFLNAPYPLARKNVRREKPLKEGEYNKSAMSFGADTQSFYPILFTYKGKGFEKGKPVNYDINLSPRLEPMFDLTLQKTVVQTPVAGRDFTVKEIISAEDWQVRIRGFFIYDAGKDGDDIVNWRYNTIAALNELARANIALKCECELFVPLGFDRLVIKQLKLPMLEGFANIIPYEIEAISDVPIELEIING
jgi:Domain of unknown function (DUF6046)